MGIKQMTERDSKMTEVDLLKRQCEVMKEFSESVDIIGSKIASLHKKLKNVKIATQNGRHTYHIAERI
eukprot:CAMPEP_0202445776 /NCGR_PEP_ID=MMETSP1360-20130828/4521_1 /ASSEMBLY_ACC=CAM_ASM_000848 /TAXON_ID=515479 /ORGANISM="Licmophora paradoxa, Strain CCMP2313" /LENGTH=67 /DNA_ID=CAMNT_0049062147 /DNA_START=354 /DNA_END=557 /DNA_ORIENTATION=-